MPTRRGAFPPEGGQCVCEALRVHLGRRPQVPWLSGPLLWAGPGVGSFMILETRAISCCCFRRLTASGLSLMVKVSLSGPGPQRWPWRSERSRHQATRASDSRSDTYSLQRKTFNLAELKKTFKG